MDEIARRDPRRYAGYGAVARAEITEDTHWGHAKMPYGADDGPTERRPH
jgi:hypothetical protein